MSYLDKLLDGVEVEWKPLGELPGAFQFYAACISGCVTQSQRSLSFRTLRFNIA